MTATATLPEPCPASCSSGVCTKCGFESPDVRYDWGTESALCNPCWFGMFPAMLPNLHAKEPGLVRGER